MNGLYNMLFGRQRSAGLALAMLGKSERDFMRFRDAWIEKDDDSTARVAVYTRMGGGNREHGDQGPCTGEVDTDPEDPCWGCWVDGVADWPGFIGADDDDFDCTYRTFYFAVPDEYAGVVAGLSASGEVSPFPVDMGDRWKTLLDGIGGDR